MEDKRAESLSMSARVSELARLLRSGGQTDEQLAVVLSAAGQRVVNAQPRHASVQKDFVSMHNQRLRRIANRQRNQSLSYGAQGIHPQNLLLRQLYREERGFVNPSPPFFARRRPKEERERLRQKLLPRGRFRRRVSE